MWLELVVVLVALVASYLFLYKRSPSPPAVARTPATGSPRTQTAFRSSPLRSNSPFRSSRSDARTSSPAKANGAASPKPVLDESQLDLKLLYGSQTGTAETFSHTLKDEAAKMEMQSLVIDLEKYSVDKLAKEAKPILIFLMATYGEGEPTDNAKEFFLWLTSTERDADPTQLAGVRYTVFGLGNKTYENYNGVATIVDRRLFELGATRVFPLGLGDDDANLEEDFKIWKKKMWPEVRRLIKGEQAGAEELPDDCEEVATRRFTLERFTRLAAGSTPSISARFTPVVPRRISAENKSESAQSHLPSEKPQMVAVYDHKTPYLAHITRNTELHSPMSDRSCRHVELRLDTNNYPSLRYEPGDHLGIFPQNDSQLVLQLVKRLGEDGQALIQLKPINAGSGEGFGPVTLETAFLYFLDITNPPRPSVLKALAAFCAEESDKKRLLHLAGPGRDDYLKEIKQPMVTILELLLMLPSLKPPLDLLLELLPRLAPRYYSISSSLRHTPARVSATVGVLTFTTGTGRVHNGVCSTWLRALEPTNRVPVFIRKSNFRLPQQISAPIIMVGPGTGLAPFRSFIKERTSLPESGPNVLFFGCRHSQHDFIYADELRELAAAGRLSLFTAFSRETERKVYVQHRIAEQWELVAKLIREGAYVYVCGDARQMPADVQKAIVEALVKSGLVAKEAEEYISKMHHDGRYQQDVWF